MSRNARFEAGEFAANASPLPWRFGEVVPFTCGIVEAGKGVMAKKLLAKWVWNLAKFDGARTYGDHRPKIKRQLKLRHAIVFQEHRLLAHIVSNKANRQNAMYAAFVRMRVLAP